MEVRNLDVGKDTAVIAAKARRVNAYQKKHPTSSHQYEKDETDLVPVIHKTIERPDAIVFRSDQESKMSEPEVKEAIEANKVPIKIQTVASEAVNNKNLDKVSVVKLEEKEEMKIPSQVNRVTAMPTAAVAQPMSDWSWFWPQAALLLVAVAFTVVMLGMERQMTFSGAGVETNLQFSWLQVGDRLSSLRTELFAHVIGS